jgi:hypothetical protein
MTTPRKTAKKRTSSRKVRSTVDPTRLALAAVERVRTVLTRTGHLERMGAPVTMRELVARGSLLNAVVPPSYSAAMRASGSIGDPHHLLNAVEMKAALEGPLKQSGYAGRYVPFCKITDRLMCFDMSSGDEDGELGIVEWKDSIVKHRAAHFAEWLDGVADDFEVEIERSASIPQGLRKLLGQLGFTFDDPIVGRLETGDAAAIEELLGPSRTREIRGKVDRIFDSSGKASLTLNLDEFTVACSLRTGIFVLEAEDVFRWLRHFRDENFFGETQRHPTHADQVRDLRKAPREPQLILRGVIDVSTMPATRHTFRAASGGSAEDFYLLGRTSSTSVTSPSLILHVVKGAVQEAHAVDEPLNDLYVTTDGTLWGLTHVGSAVRFAGGNAKAFPLHRTTRGRAWWFGIGGGGDRVLVWGAGALLEFDGHEFVPFAPDAALDPSENVVSLWASKREVAMLVCGDHLGAVARFNGQLWLPIREEQVIDTVLADLDIWRGIAIVLARDGRVWRIEDGPPRPVIWDRRQEAFLTADNVPRSTHQVRGYDGGAVLASDGGIIVVGSGEPAFYTAKGSRDAAKLARVGAAGSRSGTNDSGIVAMCGPHAWIWKGGALQVLDLREW